jgi:hypothetical protein
MELTASERQKHGLTHTRLYRVWANMKTRCRNPRSDKYKWYGARGIGFCFEWSDFRVFAAWAIKNGYSDDKELDRIDNDKDYYPENCRFISHKEQCRNRRSNHKVVLDGVVMHLSDAAKAVGRTNATILNNIKKGSVKDEYNKLHTLAET